ncbi:MAG: acetylornithine/succinylornithine family transaminase [Oscillospiraceae bacterium]|nr:acetylornithine/succinylornithine family transaminase [Oscillospiraceae bacterium]
MSITELDKQYVANTYARFPLEIVRGKGSKLYDSKGKEYIDMGTGIGVSALGTCDSEWVAAVTKQLNTLQHTSNLYYSEPCVKLAELLCNKTGAEKVFFSNSGAEANECAIKCARKWAYDNKGAEHNKIITLVNSFHGRTVTTLAATGQESFHKDFLPLTEGFLYVEAGDLDSVESFLKEEKVAGIMFETVQGEGGVVPLSQEFVSGLSALAEKYNVLLIVDEVQTGNGRTGALYGYMKFGINPDIVSTAKGIGGGLPLGATLFFEKTANTYTPGTHGSTFGGNPVACAGAVSIIERMTDEFLQGVEERSQYICNELGSAKGVKSITGLGLMLGIETERDVNEILAECRENGVLPIKAKTKVRLLPPLNIPMEDLKKAVAVIKKACEV